MKRLFCGLVALGLLVGGAGKAIADYILTTIDVPGANPGTTFAYGINEAGQIVGAYNDTPGYTAASSHGFLYSGGTFSTLDRPGAAGTAARGINSSGQIVGLSTDGSL